MNRYKEVFGSLSVHKEKNNQIIFKLSTHEALYEDQIEVEEKDPFFSIFCEFMEGFFNTPKETEEKPVEEPVKENTGEIQKWLSSVANSHVKTNSQVSDTHYKKILQNKDIEKVIPGGKYGCALMLKNCGPPELKCLSIGRIVSYVSFALKKEILIHVKTFIVKNSKIQKKPSKEADEAIKRI